MNYENSCNYWNIWLWTEVSPRIYKKIGKLLLPKHDDIIEVKINNPIRLIGYEVNKSAINNFEKVCHFRSALPIEIIEGGTLWIGIGSKLGISWIHNR